MGSSDGDGPGSSTKQMERQGSQGDVSIFSCQSIVICTILGNVFLESFQAHIEDDNNIRAVEVSKNIFFTFRGLYQTEPSGGGEMARLLTNGAPLAEDQQPISHRNNCENRKCEMERSLCC